jgi:hypothetical protein
VLNINRTAYRYEPVKLHEEVTVRAEIIDKACNFGCVGYRMVTNMIRNNGTKINHKRVERIWREEGLINCLKSRLSVADYGSMKVAVLDLEQNIETMFGAMTL